MWLQIAAKRVVLEWFSVIGMVWNCEDWEGCNKMQNTDSFKKKEKKKKKKKKQLGCNKLSISNIALLREIQQK